MTRLYVFEFLVIANINCLISKVNYQYWYSFVAVIIVRN